MRVSRSKQNWPSPFDTSPRSSTCPGGARFSAPARVGASATQIGLPLTLSGAAGVLPLMLLQVQRGPGGGVRGRLTRAPAAATRRGRAEPLAGREQGRRLALGFAVELRRRGLATAGPPAASPSPLDWNAFSCGWATHVPADGMVELATCVLTLSSPHWGLAPAARGTRSA